MSNADSNTGCAGCAARTTQITGDIGGIDRRDFLVRSGILAAAAALAACGIATDSTAPTIAAGTTVKVSDYASLANVGGIAMVNAGGAPLAIVRTGTTSFLALSRVCPHQGSIVNQNGNGFLCPNHGAQFDSHGSWIGGQPTGSLHSYTAVYDATTGVLTIS